MNTTKKTYQQTKSKLRLLWEIAIQLIANYEDFDKRLTELEKQTDILSNNINSTINGA